jgi:hypothetical protein
MAVPLYADDDLEELRTRPEVDWAALRSVRSGEASPLRAVSRQASERGAVIRNWVAGFSARYGIPAWTWWNGSAGRWEIDFERIEHASPPVQEVLGAIAADPEVGAHAAAIAVETKAGAALRWARAMRTPGAAVILDTETTGLGGYVVEIAVIDAASGETLLDTLVNPQWPIEEDARRVHGLSDDIVSRAPLWTDVLPRLLEVTEGRTVVAYNAEFDASVVARHTERDGLEPGHLADDDRWSCLMDRRSEWLMKNRWLPLSGGHRALLDCLRAYELLGTMTEPARRTRRRRALLDS